jgi:hypothetical protein
LYISIPSTCHLLYNGILFKIEIKNNNLINYKLLIKEMLPKQNSLERIPESNPVNLNVNSETELEELDEKMEYISEQISEEFHILNNIVSQVNGILNINFNNKFMNTDFDKQEYIEEYLDTLIYEYQTVKELLKKGREIRYNKDKKEKQKDNELRGSRNTLNYCGIKSEQ